MSKDRYSHCDRFRLTARVESDLKKAHRLLRINPEDGEVISTNSYGFDVAVGNMTMFCRPWGPQDSKVSTHLTLDGNPAKVGETWGLYDQRDPFGAITKTCLKTLKVLAIPFNAEVKEAIQRGEATLSRVHLTLHFFAGDTTGDTAAVLEQIKQELADRGVKFSSEGYGATAYVNKVDGEESRHWALAIYDKYRELRHKRPAGTTDEEYARILELAKGVLRVELRLNSKILPRLNLRYLHCWKDFDADALVFRYLGRLGLGTVTSCALSEDERKQLTLAQQRDYELWLKGGRLKQLMAPRTFQKRVLAFKEFGVDIRGRHRPLHEDCIDLTVVFGRKNLVPTSYWTTGIRNSW